MAIFEKHLANSYEKKAVKLIYMLTLDMTHLVDLLNITVVCLF